MSSVETIERMKCQEPEEQLKEIHKELSEEAYKLLGYHQALSESKGTDALTAMTAAGFFPFEASSVEAYKDKILMRATAYRRKIGASLWLAALILGVAILYYVRIQHDSGAYGMYIVVGILAITGTVWYCSFGEWCWKLREFKNYEKPIPYHALETAVEVKKLCPTAEFYVEELVNDYTPYPDPFLVVRAGNKNFHLEVWDEPEFEGRQTK